MKQKLIAVEDATIQTVAVEVKMISIGKKQMTLNLYRQLPEEEVLEVVDDEVELRGIVWGHVNYHMPECTDRRFPSFATQEHVHLVWQYENFLRRATVSSPETRDARVYTDKARRRLHELTNKVGQLTTRMQNIRTVGGLTAVLANEPVREGPAETAAVADWQLSSQPANAALRWGQSGLSKISREYLEADIRRQIQAAAEAAQLGPLPSAPSSYLRKILQDTSTEAAQIDAKSRKLWDSYQIHYHVLATSDQLFVGG